MATNYFTLHLKRWAVVLAFWKSFGAFKATTTEPLTLHRTRVNGIRALDCPIEDDRRGNDKLCTRDAGHTN